MASGYSQYSMASLVAEIAVLIDDPNYIQWKYEEIRYGVIEALRYWGALTSYWRARGAFSTTATVPWYDLAVQLPLLRPRTVTFNDLALEIDYHLFELPGGASGTGLSSQFTISQILTSLARSRNRFVMDAGLPLSVSSPPQAITAAPDARFFTNENFCYLRHAYWQDGPSGAWTPLRSTDAWAQDSYNPLWTLDTGLPFAFSQSVTRPLEVQLYPPPVNDGAIEWVTVSTLNFDTITASTLLAIPDEFAHAVKYAALSDLLSMDGESSDPQRSDYAERRYDQTVAVAKNHKSVARIQLNAVPLPLSTLTMLDNVSPNWRMRGGIPTNAGCDIDLIALADVPNGSFGVSCDVLQSAPIPASDGEFLQIGREMIPIVIDYVQHYLGFKLGGGEFFNEIGLYDGFVGAAKSKNSIQSKQIKFMGPLYGMPGRENDQQMPASEEKAGTGEGQQAVYNGVRG